MTLPAAEQSSLRSLGIVFNMAVGRCSTWETRAAERAAIHEAAVAEARKALANFDREELEAVADAAIHLLDEMSDPDEDQCAAGDDGCGSFMRGDGKVYRGSLQEGEADLLQPARYGDDQREILGMHGVAWRVDGAPMGR
jgi:hypothetical protein